MSDWTTDLRSAARSFTAHPGFTATVVGTLALGIAATTVLFSLIYGILLRPFPYADPDRLIRLETVQPGPEGNVQGASVQDLNDWRASSRSLAGLAGYISFDNILTSGGDAQAVHMTFVSPDVFGVLGVSPVLGRLFRAEDDRIGGETNQAVLAHQLWATRFGGDRSVIGRVIELRGAQYTVVGVMPPGFRFPDRTEVWTSLHARYAVYTDGWWKGRDVRIHNVVARLRDGVSLEQAKEDLSALAVRLGNEFPETNQGVQLRLVPLRDAEVGGVRPYLLLLLGAVVLVLLICCVNVANLLIARTAGRSRELAIRTALGAGRGRIMRLLLLESLLLALAAGVAGAALAFPGLSALLGLIPVELPAWMRFAIDGPMLGFTLLVALVTAVVAGFAPAWHLSRPHPAAALREGGRTSRGVGARRLRDGLVVSEMALSIVLLVAAGLMIRSLVSLFRVDDGIDRQRLLTVQVGRFVTDTNPERRSRAYIAPHQRALARLAQLPGVGGASGGSDFPYRDQPAQRERVELTVVGQGEEERRRNAPAVGALTWPGYFKVLGVPLVAGRDFTAADDYTAPNVVIVNRSAAEALWPGREAIGQLIRMGKEGWDNPWSRVVGVVGDTKWQATEQGPGFEIYYPYLQGPGPGFHYLLRVAGDPVPTVASLTAAVKEVAPELAVVRVRTMDQVVTEALWQRRLWGAVLAVFAAMALVLAAVGIYGVMSYLVGQRVRDFGIRLALGAGPRALVQLVVGQGMRLTALGILVGLVGSLLLSRLMASLLFGVVATDPFTYVGVSLLLGGVALVACYLPARRAARTDPVEVLRGE